MSTLVQLNGRAGIERVNPAHVVRLSSEAVGLTTIHFAGDGWLMVRHDMEDVIDRLGFSEVTL